MLTLQYTELVIFAECSDDMEPCDPPAPAAEGLLNYVDKEFFDTTCNFEGTVCLYVCLT